MADLEQEGPYDVPQTPEYEENVLCVCVCVVGGGGGTHILYSLSETVEVILNETLPFKHILSKQTHQREKPSSRSNTYTTHTHSLTGSPL